MTLGLRYLLRACWGLSPRKRAFASEGELFGSFGGSARAIAIHLQHADGDALTRAAETGRRLLTERFPGANVQAWPNADAGTPELRVQPDDRRLAEVGWRRPSVRRSSANT